jgi:hypothetical protein
MRQIEANSHCEFDFKAVDLVISLFFAQNMGSTIQDQETKFRDQWLIPF